MNLPPGALVMICTFFYLIASVHPVPLGSENVRPNIIIGSGDKEMLSFVVVTAGSKPCQVALATF